MENSLEFPQKLKLVLNPEFPLLDFVFFQKKKKKIEFKNYMNSNVHSNVLYNSQNINVSIRYRRYGVYIHTHNKTDDTTLIAESKEELKSFLMKVKEESEKSWLKAQHSEN